MSNVHLVWFGRRFEKEVKADCAARLRVVGAAIASRIQANIGKQYPPASRPGQYPAKRTGQLQRSIVSIVDPNAPAVHIYATAPHAHPVEKIRPFMHRSLREMEPEIGRIFLSQEAAYEAKQPASGGIFGRAVRAVLRMVLGKVGK